MGMFDTYVPQPPLSCPVCRTHLVTWQGKDGPCQQLVWTQNKREPEKSGNWPAVMTAPELPEEFLIYSYDCECFDDGVEAIGRCVDGTWRSTEFLRAADVDRFHRTLPKAARSARIAELRKAGL